MRNGGFEFEADGKPEAWIKYGGAIGITSDAYEGARAVTLTSDTSSTKWLYQTVRVDEGCRYVASAMSRIVDGSGEVFLRLSWYASDDGSGASTEQADSPVSVSAEWSLLQVTSDPPLGTQSVRVRLMLRPAGPATAAFDSVTLVNLGVPPAPPLAETGPPSGPTQSPDSTPGPSTAPPYRLAVPTTAPQAIAGVGLRLSEVLSDPDEPGQDSPFEWIELVNVGSDAVDLAGWKLGDARDLDLLPALVVPSGGYVLVAGKSVPAIPAITIVHVTDGAIGAGLNNSGDTLRLVSPDGAEVDALSYGDDTTIYDPPPPAPRPGTTLGVRVPGADPAADNWALTDRPSPGAPNTFPIPAVNNAKTTPTASNDAVAGDLPVRDGENRPSAIPWVALGIAAGAGIMGLGLAGKRTWPDFRQRMKRGR